MRKVSVKGLEKIGEGGNGIVYRLDDDKTIKVSKVTGNLADPKKELDTSKQAFLSGLPAAIVYDVVETEDGYGQIYEMLNASMMSAVVRENPLDVEKYAEPFIFGIERIEMSGDYHIWFLKNNVYPDVSLYADDYIRKRKLLIYSNCNKFYRRSIIE